MEQSTQPTPAAPLSRCQPQEAVREKEAAILLSGQVAELEEKNRELKHFNEHLEEQVKKLCESPFISEAFQKQER
jgi:cell division protein FtsB